MRRARLVVLALAGVLASCGGDEPAPAVAGALSGDLHVFAAASLSEAFTELGAAFEDDHPDARVTFTFAGSSALAEQINQGAPADVFVPADEASMAKVVDAGGAADPGIIARNRPAILVERGNPERITGLADLSRSDLVLVLCAPEVPCGKVAAAALAEAGVRATPDSLEENVKAVVSKVTLGEADAGIVYVTDVRAAGDEAKGIEIDVDDRSLEAVYPMAVTAQAGNPALARAWVAFVASDTGQAALARRGFLAP